MGRRGSALVGLLLVLIVLAWIGVGSIPATGSTETAAETTDSSGLDVIVINKEGYTKDRRGPVTFTHKKHALDYKILCWECHHEYVDGKNVWVPWDSADSCDTCHDPQEKQDNAMKLKTAYHVNCKNCHKALAKENKKSGPYRKCLQCHEKQ